MQTDVCFGAQSTRQAAQVLDFICNILRSIVRALGVDVGDRSYQAASRAFREDTQKDSGYTIHGGLREIAHIRPRKDLQEYSAILAHRSKATRFFGDFDVTNQIKAEQGIPRKTISERESVSKGEKFSVGDLVRLKSGGPSMTIEEMEYAGIDSVSGFYYAKCAWYLSDGSSPRATFEESMLEAAFDDS